MFISKKELNTLRSYKERVRLLEDKLTLWVPCDPKNPNPNSCRREDAIPIILRRIEALENYLNIEFQDRETHYENAKYIKKGK